MRVVTTIVAAGVIYREGRVLLTKRLSKGHLADMWELPGGKLEPGEPPEEAVVRECREECDIEVRVVDILDVTFHRYGEKELLLLFYTCEHVSGDVKHLGVADHAWVSPADIHAYELPAADRNVQRKIAARG